MIEIQKCKTTISITAEKSLKQKSFQRKQLDWLKFKNARQLYQLWLKNLLSRKSFQKQLDWLKIKKNARQHDNRKKTIMTINTTLSSFLNTEHTREIKERKENIFYIKSSFSSLYFISFKIFDWKSNSSKHFLSHIDQIFDILLEWVYCVQLLFEIAIFCTTILCWNYWVFLLGFWYKS